MLRETKEALRGFWDCFDVSSPSAGTTSHTSDSRSLRFNTSLKDLPGGFSLVRKFTSTINSLM